MIVGVPRESYPGERRVALVPAVIPNLTKAGMEVLVEAGAGLQAGYPDADYAAKGAKLVAEPAKKCFARRTLLCSFCATARTTRTEARTCRCIAQGTSADWISCGRWERWKRCRRLRRSRSDFVCGGVDAADHAGAEHGRAFVDGDDLRIQSGAAGGGHAAAHVSRC